jgi:hypothetical protein
VFEILRGRAALDELQISHVNASTASESSNQIVSSSTCGGSKCMLASIA